MRLDGYTLKSVDLTDEQISGADLVVILTDHTSIDYGRVVRLAHRVYDTRNATKSVKDGRERVRKL
jgi:UDP-N-acetyl-D-glucosamine dehydrogenase